MTCRVKRQIANDTDIYGDPGAFCLERFLGAHNRSALDLHAFVFSFGRHTCLELHLQTLPSMIHVCCSCNAQLCARPDGSPLGSPSPEFISGSVR